MSEAATPATGHKAVMHAVRVLEQRPRKDDHELSHLTRCLGDYRRELIARCNGEGASPPDRQRLAHLNAVISVVMGMHFPIGTPPWDEYEKATCWLKEIVAS